MSYHNHPLLNEADLATARRDLADALPRIFGYFRQDGARAIGIIERAMQERNAAEVVLPAHGMKGEARQLGAERLAELALHLEMGARRCIEERTALPEELADEARALRSVFHDTMTQLDRIIGTQPQPPKPNFSTHRATFGRRTG